MHSPIARILLITVTTLAQLTSGCALFYQGSRSVGIAELPATGKVGEAKLISPTQHFIVTAAKAQGSVKPEDLVAYFDEGVSLSNAFVKAWFDRLDEITTRERYDKGAMNIVGNLTTSVLGLTGAEAKQLALLGLGLAGINSEYQNYEANYLISPQLAAIEAKLQEGRSAYLVGLKTSIELAKANSTLTYGQVRSAIEAYHNQASRRRIVEIVAASINAVSYAPYDQNGEAKRAKLNEAFQSLFQSLYGTAGRLDEQSAQALYLYYFYFFPSKTPDDKNTLLGDAVYKAHIGAFNALIKDSANQERVKALTETLADIGPLIGGPALIAKAKANPGFKFNKISAETGKLGSGPQSIEAAIATTPVIRAQVKQ